MTGDDMAPACGDCGLQRPLVGLGDPPDWLCQDCFEEAMRALGEKLRRFVQARRN